MVLAFFVQISYRIVRLTCDNENRGGAKTFAISSLWKPDVTEFAARKLGYSR